LHDYTSPSTGKKSYRGDADNWKQCLQKMLGAEATHVQGFSRVTPPKGDNRLVLCAPSLAARRQLLGALRKRRGSVRGTPHLSHVQRQCKTFIYRTANFHRVQIEDRGDILRVHFSDQGELVY
jgi:hypothetical protein